VRYRERLSVGASWWAVGLFFSVSFVTAVGFYLGPGVAAVAGLLTTGALAGALLAIGRTTIVVDAEGLHAGRSFLDWTYAGSLTPLDRAATRHRLGPGADHRGYLMIRPWVDTAVLVEIDDPDDPHPYWVVSSRHPQRMVAAATAARQAISGTGQGDPATVDSPG